MPNIFHSAKSQKALAKANMTKEEKQWAMVLVTVFMIVLMLVISYTVFYTAFSAINQPANANLEKRK